MTTVVTQCRLCGTAFPERVFRNAEGALESASVRSHPMEDGNPWCLECKVRLRHLELTLLPDLAR
ncbi:MAG: hypothetical protein ACE5IG_01090 [Dehalococcoidia bacterium]